jgi:hypothetical protein
MTIVRQETEIALSATLLICFFVRASSMNVTPTGSTDFTCLTAPKTGLRGGAIPDPS